MTSDEEHGVEQSQNGGVVGTETTCVDALLLEEVDLNIDSEVNNESAVPQGENDQRQPPSQQKAKSFLQRLLEFYRQYDFLILLIAAVLLAKAYPPLGAIYLAPKITATWIAVMYIFCKFLHVRCVLRV